MKLKILSSLSLPLMANLIWQNFQKFVKLLFGSDQCEGSSKFTLILLSEYFLQRTTCIFDFSKCPNRVRELTQIWIFNCRIIVELDNFDFLPRVESLPPLNQITLLWWRHTQVSLQLDSCHTIGVVPLNPGTLFNR